MKSVCYAGTYICWTSYTVVSSSLQKFRICNGWSMGGNSPGPGVLCHVFVLQYCISCYYGCVLMYVSLKPSLQARQSTFQRTLSVLSRVKGFFSASGLIPSGKVCKIMNPLFASKLLNLSSHRLFFYMYAYTQDLQARVHILAQKLYGYIVLGNLSGRLCFLKPCIINIVVCPRQSCSHIVAYKALI